MKHEPEPLQAADMCGGRVPMLGCQASLLRHLEPLPMAHGLLRSSPTHR